MKITELTEELNEFFGLFGDDEPEVNHRGFPYYTNNDETDLPVVKYILKAYRNNEGKTLQYLTQELKYPRKAASLLIIRAQTPGVGSKYPKFKPVKPQSKKDNTTTIAQKIGLGNRYESVSEDATAGATTAGNIASVANPNMAYAKPKKRGKYGAPKAPQKKNPDGTAKNALDDNTGLMSGKPVKR